MNKIIELFRDIRFEEFLRIVIADGNMSLVHISENRVINKLEVDLIDKIKIFEYLKEHLSVPLEVIISTSTISCRSIALDRLREKDVIALANNVIDGKNGTVNLACYEKKFSYRRGNALFCDMKLTPITTAILQETINLGNPISSVVAWPFWIVSSYFRLHPTDSGKFKAPIFVIKQQNSWEIIGLYKNKHVYYRKGILDGFDEKSEVDNAIKFVNQLFNTELDDVVIYSINDETIDTFTFPSNINMKLVSKTWDFAINDKVRNANIILKSACVLLFFGFFSNTIMDVVKIFNYNSRSDEAKKTINSVDPDVVDEIATWNSLEEFVPISHLDVKSKISEKSKDENKKLQNISVKADEKTKQTKVNAIYEEE